MGQEGDGDANGSEKEDTGGLRTDEVHALHAQRKFNEKFFKDGKETSVLEFAGHGDGRNRRRHHGNTVAFNSDSENKKVSFHRHLLRPIKLCYLAILLCPRVLPIKSPFFCVIIVSNCVI